MFHKNIPLPFIQKLQKYSRCIVLLFQLDAILLLSIISFSIIISEKDGCEGSFYLAMNSMIYRIGLQLLIPTFLPSTRFEYYALTETLAL